MLNVSDHVFCAGVVLSKEDKELQRVRQLKQIKLKYGLKVSLPFCLYAQSVPCELLSIPKGYL